MKTTLVQYKTNDIGFKVKTPTGFEFFDGIAKLKNETKMLKITLKDGKNICVTDNHIFSNNGNDVKATDIEIGTKLQTEDGQSEVVNIAEDTHEEFVYDLINVRNGNVYYTNKILSHNCRFLGSSNTLIEADTLERISVTEAVDSKYGGAMLIYEAPQPGSEYILGVDSAKGNGSDYSTIQVLKIVSSSEIYQVATYRNNLIAPDNFAQLAIGISTYYNKAYMMVESNDIGELVTNKIWYDYECDRLINCDRKGLGIRATRKSKLEGNLLLKKYVENGWLEIKDRRTLYELSRYEEVSPNVFHAAGQNENDDCVTSLIWALYYTTTEYFGDDGNTKSRIIDAKYRLDEADVPVFIGDTDNFSNEYTWSSY